MSSKITIIGAGSVGSTIAYTLSNQDIASEIVLIDINKEKVAGEVMDIIQGTCFRDPINIKAGEYEDAKDSNIVIITSGIARKPGQTRIELAQTNVNILKDITPKIVKEAPNALYVIVSNPVDIMTYVFTKISGLPENQILGSGTILDSARLRCGLSEHFQIAQSNIHAYVFGEHGDTSFIPWSGAYISGVSVDEYYDLEKKLGKDIEPIDKEAMLQFGSDKPDLRNPLRIIDVTDFFQRCTFKPFHGQTVRAINVHAKLSKGQHEKLLKFAQSIGMGGLGYLEVKEELKYKGPIDKFIPDDMKMELAEMAGLQEGDTIFFIAAPEKAACIYAGQIRNELGSRLDLLEKDAYRFCYINDFPMYEIDEETGKLGFTHNPFSMPQGGLEALNEKDPLDILAYQYDIVCNGVELSSGAVRNHDMEIMEKAFDIAGYDKETLKDKFGALYNAFQFGAPPHAGMAPGVDRMIMLLRNEENIREIIAFPMSGTAQDLMCGAPNEITEQQLREVHIKVRD